MNKGDALAKLRREYLALGVTKKVVRAQVKADFEVKIQMEVQRRVAEAEAEFARHLAAEKERHDLTVSSIQDEVLRTRTWTRWEKWRDMADIEPERISIQYSRERRRDEEKPYRIEGDHFVTVKDQHGKDVEPLAFRAYHSKYNGPMADALDPADYPRFASAFGSYPEAVKFLTAELKKYGDFEEENGD